MAQYGVRPDAPDPMVKKLFSILPIQAEWLKERSKKLDMSEELIIRDLIANAMAADNNDIIGKPINQDMYFALEQISQAANQLLKSLKDQE